MTTTLFVNCCVATWNVYRSTKQWDKPEQAWMRFEFSKRLLQMLPLSTFFCRSCAVTKSSCESEENFLKCESWFSRGHRTQPCWLMCCGPSQMVLFINQNNWKFCWLRFVQLASGGASTRRNLTNRSTVQNGGRRKLCQPERSKSCNRSRKANPTRK